MRHLPIPTDRASSTITKPAHRPGKIKPRDVYLRLGWPGCPSADDRGPPVVRSTVICGLSDTGRTCLVVGDSMHVMLISAEWLRNPQAETLCRARMIGGIVPHSLRLHRHRQRPVPEQLSELAVGSQGSDWIVSVRRWTGGELLPSRCGCVIGRAGLAGAWRVDRRECWADG